MTGKTDNHNPAAKIALRKYFLDKYHPDGDAEVFDCCQGSGLLWREIRKTHWVASYWGVDVKPKKGRLEIDSARILAQEGWGYNVVDVDTYGAPWKHWVEILRNATKPTTVFLTVGRGGGNRVMLSDVERTALGIRFEKAKKMP